MLEYKDLSDDVNKDKLKDEALKLYQAEMKILKHQQDLLEARKEMAFKRYQMTLK